MKKRTASTDTRDQLRALMQQHSDKTAPQRAPTSGEGTSPEPRIPELKALSGQSAPNERCTVRLMPAEIHRVNTVIAKAIQDTHERVTVTDVLRIGLQRLEQSSPITAAEILLLRTTDGRRHKRPTV